MPPTIRLNHTAKQHNESVRDTEFDMQETLKDIEQNLIAHISLESGRVTDTVKDLFKAGGTSLNPKDTSPAFSNSIPGDHNTSKTQATTESQHNAHNGHNGRSDPMSLDHVVHGHSNLENQDSEARHSPPNLRKRKFEELSEEESRNLKVLLAATEEKLNESEKRSQVSAAQVEELKQKNTKLYDQVKQYKSILLESGGKLTEDVPDEKIKQDYASLRDQIYHMVAQYYRLDTKVRPRGLTDESFEWLREFADLYNYNTNSENLRKRFRGLIFGYVNTDIFGRPLFGIQSGEIQEALAYLEEKMLSQNPDNYPDIVEWRIQTMKCISTFDDGQTEATNLAKTTYNDLKPFMRGPNKNGKELFEQYIKLYTDAQNLALLMRSSKHIYKVEMPLGNSDYNEEESVALGREIFDNSSGKPEREVINYLVFGALVKFPEGNLERRILLERAHVVTAMESA